uniref:Uncharacterized protein n=1 Tax=Candidatus Kentrum sp. LFY TaxID=2126342 RepID=A0A450U616_9GAMM|nr:MAG: hypothetical protein BECKLFY1418B_GA0070995_100489 [Candidatus Kentron sp. LFY]
MSWNVHGEPISTDRRAGKRHLIRLYQNDTPCYFVISVIIRLKICQQTDDTDGIIQRDKALEYISTSNYPHHKYPTQQPSATTH